MPAPTIDFDTKEKKRRMKVLSSAGAPFRYADTDSASDEWKGWEDIKNIYPRSSSISSNAVELFKSEKQKIDVNPRSRKKKRDNQLSKLLEIRPINEEDEKHMDKSEKHDNRTD